MKKVSLLSLCILLVLCIESNKVRCEELTWGSCTTYAPMPVLFIHGINSNALTWKDAIPKLKEYFNYREFKPFSDEKIVPRMLNFPPGAGITYFKDEKTGYESPARLYLEAFDYGGRKKMGTLMSIKINSENLEKEVRKVLEGYYGKDYRNNRDAKVILVAHSLGGVITRYYLQQESEFTKKHIKRFIAMGSPLSGTHLSTLAYISTIQLPLIGIFISPKKPWLIPGAVFVVELAKFKDIGFIGKHYWQFLKGEGPMLELLPDSDFVKKLVATSPPEEIETICLVGHKNSDKKRGDGIIGAQTQMAMYKGKSTISWDKIIDLYYTAHGDEPKQITAILKALDGIPDKGTKTYDTPKIALGTSTFIPGTPSLYYQGPANNFYITGKIYDYLPGSCTITVEIKKGNSGNIEYAYDKDGKIKDRQLIKPINMNKESQEVSTNTTTPTYLNARFNFHPLNSLTPGTHTFRLTVTNPGSLTATATTKDGSYWIPFKITALPTPNEILSKVAENFGKINDMKAKMVDFGTATLITEEGTETKIILSKERILIHKIPDKVRIETPSEDTIFIINQDTWYIKSKEIGICKIDISEEEELKNIFSSPLALYAPFMEDKKGYKEIVKEYKNNIYTLEVIPENEEPEGKIVLEVDYGKGIILKSEVYDTQGDIVIRTETKEIKLLPESIWFPTRYLETKFIDTFTMVTETIIRDIVINSGVEDRVFSLEIENEN